MASKDLRYKNLAVIDPLYSPLLNCCNWIALNEDSDTGQSVSPTIIDGGSHAYASQSTKAHAKFTSSGTSVSMTTSLSNFFSLDNGVSILDADLTLLDADYTLIQQLLDGSLTTGLSFSASNVKHYYPCTDNDSLEFIQDVIIDISSNITDGYYKVDGGQTFTEITDGHNIVSTSSSSTNSRPVSGRTYPSYVGQARVTLTMKVNSGTIYHRATINEGQTIINSIGALGVGTHIIVLIVEITSASTLHTQLNGQEEYVFDVDVTHTVEPLAASEITGYTDKCRDYFKNVPYGLPTTRTVQGVTGRLLSIADEYTARFANSDGRNLPIGFKPNIPEYTLVLPYSGELQTFDADTKKIAASVDSGWTDNSDHTYTGATATGDIVGISTATSGEVYVLYTLSNVTAGSVEGNDSDGVYSFNETLSASLNLSGVGFTGTVTINSILPLSTKTQRDDIRVVTHDEESSIVSSTDPFGDSSLMTKYEMDGDATDSASTEDATATDVTWVDGNYGQAGDFYTNDVASMITPVLTDIKAVSFMVYIPTGEPEVSASQYIFDTRTSGDAYLICKSNNITFLKGGYDKIIHDGALVPETVHSFTFDAWNHIYFEFTNLQTTEIMFGNFTTPAEAYGFCGSIDQIEFYDRPLSDSEIASLRTQTVEQNTYRINHVEQDTAILPDADTAMTQSDTALLGYADTITECLGNAEGYSYAMTTAQQLTAINAMILANFDVLTDEFDVPLTDENGMYMYTR